MMTLVLVALVVVGLCLGSFVNALVWRLHEQARLKHTKKADKKQLATLSITQGRSMCPHCRHELAASDLIPLMSWVMLRGKCRYCKAPISWQYPLVELATALLFIASYAWWPHAFTSAGIFGFVLWLIFLTAFMALAVYDIRWFLLPDRIVYPLIGLAIIQVVVDATAFGGGWQTIVRAAWGVLFIAGLFYLIYLTSRGGWIGFGDVKLAIVLGLLVGGPLSALLLIFIGSLLGSIVAIPMLVRGRAKATSHMPFGPFLLAGCVVVVLFGTHITDWYTNLLYL